MKLGYIDYLNCYPYYYRMFEIEPVPGVDIIPGYPSQLNSMIVQGTIDMSPVSAAVYPDVHDDDVRPEFGGYFHCSRSFPGLRNNIQAGLFMQKRSQTVTKNSVIVYKHYFDLAIFSHFVALSLEFCYGVQ